MNPEVPIDDEDLVLEYFAQQKELNPDGPDFEGFVLRYRGQVIGIGRRI